MRWGRGVLSLPRSFWKLWDSKIGFSSHRGQWGRETERKRRTTESGIGGICEASEIAFSLSLVMLWSSSRRPI